MATTGLVMAARGALVALLLGVSITIGARSTPMAGETINFDGGESLATLGFINISGLTNTNGVGEGGSWAMHGDDRFDEASYPVTPTARPLCLTFWWNRTVTDGSIYLVEARAGAAFQYNVSIQVRSGSADGLIDSRAGFSELVPNLWPTVFPAIVRIQIVPSTGGTFASPASDGVIKIWHGPAVDSLTLVYDRSDVPIYDFTKDGAAAYNRLHFAPQGDIDSIVWSDALCAAAVVLASAPQDYSTPDCCTSGPGQSAGDPIEDDPTRPAEPFVSPCTGGGTVPTAAAPTFPETWC